MQAPVVRTTDRAVTGLIQARRHLKLARQELQVARLIFEASAGCERDAIRVAQAVREIDESEALLR